MTIGANAQVSVTDKLAGFASNAQDISTPKNPFELSRILSTSSHRNIDALFLSPALRSLGDDGYLGETIAAKKEYDLQTRLLMSIEMKAQRIAATEKAMEEAEKRSEAANRARQKPEEKREKTENVATSRTQTTASQKDDDRPKLSRNFNKRSEPGFIDSAIETGKQALETADRAVTETVKVARRTAGDAVETTASAVGLDGKAVRRVARDTVDNVVTPAFKAAAMLNPVTAAATVVEHAPAALNSAKSMASRGTEWVKSWF